MSDLDLVTKNIPLVRRIANKINSKSHHDDLVGEGMLTLVKLANRFDPSRGTPFGMFAHKRIRGAMLKYLRKLTNDTVSIDDRDANGDHYLNLIGSDGQANRVTLKDILAYHLNPVEEWVVLEKYFHKAKFEDICSGLGMGMSRVSLIHKNAIRKLRDVIDTEVTPQEGRDVHADGCAEALLQVVRKMLWDEWGLEFVSEGEI